ncbi:Zinc finger, GRF-type [Trema orientale]|uniref:Zinc finger, GRF-type n=1 Tax=Trema orientale TaxID=63057 RepID=A0A2P5DTX5_TREOI|nr:Zinc finger, GRF-type [Trema orientale]
MDTSSHGSRSGSSELVQPYCKCGQLAVCRVSWTRENPGRRFFGCPNFVHGRNTRTVEENRAARDGDQEAEIKMSSDESSYRNMLLLLCGLY